MNIHNDEKTSFSGVLDSSGDYPGHVSTRIWEPTTKHGRREIQGSREEMSKNHAKTWTGGEDGGGQTCRVTHGPVWTLLGNVGHEVIQGDGDGSGHRCNISNTSKTGGVLKELRTVYVQSIMWRWWVKPKEVERCEEDIRGRDVMNDESRTVYVHKHT